MNIGRSLQNKTEKGKAIGNLSEKVDLYWFWNLPVNRRLCTRGWRPSKRTPPNNRVYTIFVKRKTKQLCEKVPLGSNSAIAFMSSSVSSLCCSVEDEADWSMPSEPDVDTGFWMQGDSMRHSITLIPNFCLDRPFGFSVHRDTHFFPSRLFRFSTCRVYRFFSFHPLFFPEPFWFAGKP